MLQQGKTLRIRVTDAHGSPIEGAYVWHDTFESPRNPTNPPVQVEFRPQTDAAGRVVWEHAPDRELSFQISRQGFMKLKNFRVRPSDEEHVAVLSPALVIRGRVIDVETENPIPAFRIGIGWPQDNPFLQVSTPQWSTIDRFWPAFAGGEYHHVLEEPVISGIPNPGYHLRFEAEGYAPHVSRRIAPDEGEVILDVALNRTAKQRLTVLRPDGKPASGAEAAWLPLPSPIQLLRGRFDPNGMSISLRADGKGVLALTPEPEASRLVIVHESGIADIDSASLTDDTEIVLRRWARIEGVAWEGGKPAADRSFRLTAPALEVRNLNLGAGAYHLKTGANGGFSFSHVPPMKIVLQRMEPIEPAPGPGTAHQVVAVEVVQPEPGEVVYLEPGKGHRTVSATLSTPVAGHIAWAVVTTPTPVPPAEVRHDPQALMRWHMQPEIREQMLTALQFPAEPAGPGVWKTDNVPPGRYILRAAVLPPDEAPAPNSMPPMFQATLVVPPGEGAVDLGELVLEPAEP